MKKYPTLLGTIILLSGCNTPPKTDDVLKRPATDSVVVYQDTPKPIYTDEEEETIRKDSLLRINKVFPYLAKYSFESYKTNLYSGTLKAPDFTGNPFAKDKEYVNFITEGCKRGINFGGKYTVIEKGCGAMCSFLFMVDRENGKIIDTAELDRVDGFYGFAYNKDSYLLIANATSLIDASLDGTDQNSRKTKPEIFIWKDNRFKRLE